MSDRRERCTGLVVTTVLLPALASTACIDRELDLEREVQEACWHCGNSPVIDVWEFHELHAEGIPNSAGIQVQGMSRHGLTYRPAVVGAVLVGRSIAPGVYPDIAGVDLIGAKLDVSTPAGAYEIRVSNVSQGTPYVVGPADMNETYELEYTAPGNPRWRNLCFNPPADSEEFPDGLEALLFAGDRYDAVTKEVTATGVDDGWFNIGCAGSNLAKLHLNRRTDAGSTPSIQTSQAERQAMLKMFGGDYCGNGVYYSHQGVPIDLEDVQGHRTVNAGYSSFEGLWGDKGAMCLDESRLEAEVPGITQQIVDDCALAGVTLKPCNAAFPSFPSQWPQDAALFTVNP